MWDRMSEMFGSPQGQEALFRLMAQRVAQIPAEKREALGRVEVAIVRKPTGVTVSIGESDDPQVREITTQALGNWAGLLSRSFQAMGFRVKLYE